MRCKFKHGDLCCNIAADKYLEECVTDGCECAVPMTNLQVMQSLTEEEIAEWVCDNGAVNTLCDIVCGGDCNAYATLGKSSMDVCKEIVMEWLNRRYEGE